MSWELLRLSKTSFKQTDFWEIVMGTFFMSKGIINSIIHRPTITQEDDEEENIPIWEATERSLHFFFYSVNDWLIKIAGDSFFCQRTETRQDKGSHPNLDPLVVFWQQSQRLVRHKEEELVQLFLQAHPLLNPSKLTHTDTQDTQFEKWNSRTWPKSSEFNREEDNKKLLYSH